MIDALKNLEVHKNSVLDDAEQVDPKDFRVLNKKQLYPQFVQRAVRTVLQQRADSLPRDNTQLLLKNRSPLKIVHSSILSCPFRSRIIIGLTRP